MVAVRMAETELELAAELETVELVDLWTSAVALLHASACVALRRRTVASLAIRSEPQLLPVLLLAHLVEKTGRRAEMAGGPCP